MLMSFAANAAVLAVRRNAPELIAVGLCALAIEEAVVTSETASWSSRSYTIRR